MKICLILEGSYPYVNGGVSTWMHSYIQGMPHHEFVLWVIGAKAENRGKFVYTLPPNVTEIHEVFLDEALALESSGPWNGKLTDDEAVQLERLMDCGRPDWNTLFDLYHVRKLSPMAFLQSENFLRILTGLCLRSYPYIAFSDAFHTIRSMLLPVLYLLGTEVPRADVYHAICTGYAGLLAALGGTLYEKPVLLTEHGIYAREREEELLRADWVQPAFQDHWIRFFYMLSDLIYQRCFRITSLFERARQTQIDMGCDPKRCTVIPNGIDYSAFSAIPLKPEDGWVEIGAVVRLAPIKDIKTLLYAFFELSSRVANVRLHVLGGTDDPEYAEECYRLAEQLKLKNVLFAGQVSVTEYLRKLDFTVLTSISEGLPLSVLESFAAGRPAVVTDVGCCRALILGEAGDDLGAAGYCVPPMHREALADALERMCKSRKRREIMGQIGQERVRRCYQHGKMLESYEKLYKEVETNYGGNRI